MQSVAPDEATHGAVHARVRDRRAVAHASVAIALWGVAVAATVLTVRGAVHHAPHHHASDGVSLRARWLAWSSMTLAMMLPTAVPMLRTFWSILETRRRSNDEVHSPGRAPLAWWAFLAAYAAVWLGVAGALAVAHAVLARSGVIDATGAASTVVVAASLLAAGGYQFSPVKVSCLVGCARPMTFFLSHWRDGVIGGWVMGVRHGGQCVGCCAVLMALALVGGLHSIMFMSLATVVMVIEKLPSIGERVRAPLGAVLLAAGAAVLVGAAV